MSQELDRNGQYYVSVCFGKYCSQKGAENVFEQIANGLQDIKEVVVEESFCLGECNKGPNVEFNKQIQSASTPNKLMLFKGVGRWEIFGGTKISTLVNTVKQTIKRD